LVVKVREERLGGVKDGCEVCNAIAAGFVLAAMVSEFFLEES